MAFLVRGRGLVLSCFPLFKFKWPLTAARFAADDVLACSWPDRSVFQQVVETRGLNAGDLCRRPASELLHPRARQTTALSMKKIAFIRLELMVIIIIEALFGHYGYVVLFGVHMSLGSPEYLNHGHCFPGTLPRERRGQSDFPR